MWAKRPYREKSQGNKFCFQAKKNDPTKRPSISWNKIGGRRRSDLPGSQPVVINNFGSSGMKPVTSGPTLLGSPSTAASSPSRSTTASGPNFLDVVIPKDQSGAFFGVGSSMSFNGGGKQGRPSGPTPTPSSQQIINSLPSINQNQVGENIFLI